MDSYLLHSLICININPSALHLSYKLKLPAVAAIHWGIENSSVVGGYLYITFIALIQNGYTTPTEMTDKVSKFEYHILPSTELGCFRTISNRTDVVWSKQHHCEPGLGMPLKLFDNRKPLIWLLL